MEKSPDIHSLENQLASAESHKRQALAPAEPSLSASSNDMTQPFRLGSPTSTVYQITQTLGFPGRAFVNRSGLSAQAQVIAAQLASMRLQVAANIKQAYFGLELARRNLELNAEQRESYERIVAITKRRYESGAITQVDLLNAQATLYSNDNDLADLNSAEKQALTQLNILIGNPGDTAIELGPLPACPPPPGDFDKALHAMLDHRPEILAAHRQVDAAGASHTLAWMQLLPDFQLTAGETFYNVPGASPLASSTGENHTYMAGVQITIPIWGLFNEREAIVAAGHDEQTADANLQVLYNQSKVALRTAVENLAALHKKNENSEQRLLPLSQQAFNLALINYSSGKIDFQTLADTATAMRGYKRDYASNLVAYLNAYTAYGQLIGEDL
jgi:outer membrane protein TolC